MQFLTNSLLTSRHFPSCVPTHPGQLCPFLLFGITSYGIEYYFGLSQLSWLCSLPAPCVPPRTWLAGQHQELNSPWLSAALQQPKLLVNYQDYFSPKSKAQTIPATMNPGKFCPRWNQYNYSYVFFGHDIISLESKIWVKRCHILEVLIPSNGERFAFTEYQWKRILLLQSWQYLKFFQLHCSQKLLEAAFLVGNCHINVVESCQTSFAVLLDVAVMPVKKGLWRTFISLNVVWDL